MSRLVRLLPVAALACLCALPAAAQAPDFGADTSTWANDGECDDPRFTGPGMTTTMLLDADIRADATDCRNAFNAGTITLIGGATTTPPPGKTPPGQAQPQGLVFSGINFGDDSGSWPNDGECDDRRFVGFGMANGVTTENVGRDAADCSSLFSSGRVTLWSWSAALAATQCAAINFGDDSGDYPNDDDCDDPRFDGPGAAFVLNPEWQGRDATDCRRMCDFGMVALRDF